MPRANRYFLPGHVWHSTHRCRKKEFLLSFSKDRIELKDRLCLIMVHLGHEKQALSNDNTILLE